MNSVLVRVAAALGVALAFTTVATAQSLPADQLAAIKFRAIRVDMSQYTESGLSGLIARSSSGYPESLSQNLLQHARQTFANRMTSDPRAPVLVIRVDSVSKTDGFRRNGGRGGFSSQDNTTDYMEGAGVILQGGRVLATTPMLAARGSHDASANNAERLDALSDYYVSWLKRQMGL